MLKLSKTSKLDGILSWSLQALETCPGSIGADGALVPACAGCYATAGRYLMPNTKAPRLHNREDWQRAEWVSDMVQTLESQRYFRWFDSGDMYSLALAEKILAVMQATPWVKHWLPTRMQKFAKFADVLARMRALPNVSVRFSSDSITGEHGAEHGSVIVQHAEDAPMGAPVCRAYEHEGKCNGCRVCWNKGTKTVYYVAHGKKIAKQYKVINIFKG